MSDIPSTFEYLGWYAPPEARKLLDALEKEGVPVHAEFHDGLQNLSGADVAYGGFGGSASVLIAVESARRPDVDTIHGRIFGIGLPTVTSEGPDADDWYDETAGDEIELIERRAAVARDLDAREAELKQLLSEVAAVDAELLEGGQSPQRLDALRRARERHSHSGDRLLAEKRRLMSELQEIDSTLYGPQGSEEAQSGPRD